MNPDAVIPVVPTPARVLLVAVTLLWLASQAAAAGAADAVRACRAASGPATRPLVELYTSEGCSSCPPADRWLASASGNPALAIAFHVDYWDRLGWADRFASHAFTLRQYAAMRANGASFVYTPQVLLQGRDFPQWREPGAQAAIAAQAAHAARAALALDARVSGGEVTVRADARVDDPSLRPDAALFVAYVDSGLHSDIGAGENRGLRLGHDHVVRALRQAGALDAGGGIHARVAFGRPAEAGSMPMIVAFVQRRSDGDVLQALALPLTDCGAP